jgi:hypothetical protein
MQEEVKDFGKGKLPLQSSSESLNNLINKTTTMQEKTLEELLDEYAEIYKFWDKERRSYANPRHIEPGLERMQDILSFISSREEKAREEGRKEGYWEGVNVMNDEDNKALTQYKEELLGKLPKEKNGAKWDLQEYHETGWNECLSEVKKLL